MKAVCRVGNKAVVREVSEPKNAPKGHLLLRLDSAAVNSGDIGFIHGLFQNCPESRDDIAGVSGVGEIIEVGEGVPERRFQVGMNACFYRSLNESNEMVGTWSAYVVMPYMSCIQLPQNLNPREYSGSLVNSITPLAYWNDVSQIGVKAIVCTAGLSATGRAMFGVCKAKNLPCISIVRRRECIDELLQFGANVENVISEDDANFEELLKSRLESLGGKVAVFDGVGGALLGRVCQCLPYGSCVHVYGFLSSEPLVMPTLVILGRGLTISGFGNFISQTVMDKVRLEAAMEFLEGIIASPEFRTEIGKEVGFDEIEKEIESFHHHRAKLIIVPSINN